MNQASAIVIFAVILLTASTDVQGQQNSHKQPCPEGYEYYCLNGGECFSITIAGHTTRACQCVIGYTGTRCQFRSVDLDILYGNGPEKDVQGQQNSHKQSCTAGYEYYCLNGGECFSITIAGYTTRACQCAIGYTGTRCQFRSIDLDILYGNGPEKVDIAQHDDHTLPCPPGNEYHCLNGGTCFVVNLGGGHVSNRACHCTSEFTGRRCEYQNIPLDLLGDLDSEPYHGR